MGAEEFVQQDMSTVDPWTVIKRSAEAMGIPLLQPKKNCKHCFGRGWIARRSDSKEPIPCSCIFPKETYDREIGEVEYKPRNRAERRARNK